MSRYFYALDDRLDSWLADDKVSHFFGGFAAYCLTHSFRAVLLAAIAVELLELYRWLKWVGRGSPQPWPWMTDKVSIKDIAVALLGAGIAWLA